MKLFNKCIFLCFAVLILPFSGCKKAVEKKSSVGGGFILGFSQIDWGRQRPRYEPVTTGIPLR
jgi:hypothetical protein